MTGAHHCAQLLIEMGSCEPFALGWLQNMILLISASQVTRIIGVNHYCPANTLKIENLRQMQNQTGSQGSRVKLRGI
jgi:hypothetical protein